MTDRSRVALIASSILLLVLIVHILLIIGLLHYSTTMSLQMPTPALQQALQQQMPMIVRQRPAAAQPTMQQLPVQPPPQQPAPQAMEEIVVGRRAGNAAADPAHTTVPRKGTPHPSPIQQQPSPATTIVPEHTAQDTIAPKKSEKQPIIEQLQQLGRLAHHQATKIAQQKTGGKRGESCQPERLTLASFAAPALQQGVMHDGLGEEAEGMDDRTVFGDLRFKSYCDTVWREIRNAYKIAQMYGLPKTVQADAARKNLATTVFITIHKEGSIGDVSIISSCGDPIIDQFVVKALHNVGMLPPFPKALAKERIGFGLTFFFGEGQTSESIDKFKAW
ncbi:TonB family protein [Candidatus Dependentiae bacterium]|nr:TonB family protein [Candidatus Dependentiae bacterium]